MRDRPWRPGARLRADRKDRPWRPGARSRGRPDRALIPARVQFDRFAAVGEDPDGEVLVEGPPAGITLAGEADPGLVHLAGQVLRPVRPDDELGAAGREVVEHERDLERVAGPQA